MGWHLPRHRRTPAARLCTADRDRPRRSRSMIVLGQSEADIDAGLLSELSGPTRTLAIRFCRDTELRDTFNAVGDCMRMA
jgi:hypothetical protein